MATLSATDLIGKRFHRWTIVGPNPDKPHTYSKILCRCDCGVERVIRYSSLVSGISKSCRCGQNRHRKHGMSHTAEHSVWRGMICRCSSPKTIQWKDYGGRGIKVCDRWKVFLNFYEDMGPRPATPMGLQREYTVERRDVNGDYCPENCYWTNYKVQNNNKRGSRLIEYNAQSLTTSEWAREYGFAPDTIISRIAHGWDIHRALTTPVMKQAGKKTRGERVRRRPPK